LVNAVIPAAERLRFPWRGKEFFSVFQQVEQKKATVDHQFA
jgi:hypothetical protein